MVNNRSADGKRRWVQSLDREDPLEEGTATQSSILPLKIPWTEEPGRLESRNSRTSHKFSAASQLCHSRQKAAADNT